MLGGGWWQARAGHVRKRDAALFRSARDATRTAMELPAKLRAFALPVLTDLL